MENPAAILYGVMDMRYEHHPVPAAIPAGHVRVLMRAVGICGSDVHFYQKVPPPWPVQALPEHPVQHCSFQSTARASRLM